MIATVQFVSCKLPTNVPDLRTNLMTHTVSIYSRMYVLRNRQAWTYSTVSKEVQVLTTKDKMHIYMWVMLVYSLDDDTS
jgi:hypothetical protein